MARKLNRTYSLAQFYVKEVKCREWLPSDKVVLAHAKALLKDYPYEDLLACLKAIRDNVIEVPYLNSLAALRHGEPAIIERWFQYKKTPPPVYMETLYKDWEYRVKEAQPIITEEGDKYECDPLPL
jgi:hypothetical protein